MELDNSVSEHLLGSLGVPAVTLYTNIETSYVSPIIGGLCDLDRLGLIRLRYDYRPELANPAHLAGYGVWMEVCWPTPNTQGPASPLLAYFDLYDAASFRDTQLISKADIYFKRGYQQHEVDQLPEPARRKVVKMPLHHPVRGYTYNTKAQIGRAIAAGNWRQEFSLALRRTALSLIRGIPAASALNVRQLPPSSIELEGSQAGAIDKRIYFRTRLYEPESASSEEIAEMLTALNASRIAIVAALREAFGPKAFAGFYETAGSRKYAPDLITSLPEDYADSSGHRRFSQRFLINVNTVGVSGSNGWKIPEVLASGRCLVSEALQHDHLGTLEPGVNLAIFDTPATCVSRCDELLNAPELAARMGIAGRDYYRQFLQPDAAMARVLETTHPVTLAEYK